MKKIGSGWQFDVYELGVFRVIKFPKTKLKRFFRILPWNLFNIFQIFNQLKAIEKLTSKSILTLKKLNLPEMEFLGNPKFLDGDKYEQDKVIILKDYFKSHSLDENKRIILAYFENIFECWNYGFSDVVFNFCKNSGVNDSGKVILVDLGELSFSKKEVENLIKSKKWLLQFSYFFLFDFKLKRYFNQEAEKYLTLDNLNKYWGSKRI